MGEKVAVVTGAGSGIGRAVALGLVAAGYRVALAGRTKARLDSTAAQAAGGATLVVPTDVTRPDQVTALFAETAAHWGRIDLLFNNAGTFDGGAPIDAVDYEAWKHAIDVNLHGAFLCAREAFRWMKAQSPMGGRIINNGSVSAQAPRPNAVAYTAAKHAVSGLTKSVSLEGRAWNIACGQIDIGNAATDMTQQIGAGMLQADGSLLAEPRMDTAHVVRTVLLMAELPLDANIQSVTVMATAMPLIGRG